MENNWAEGQAGWAVQLTVKTEGGTIPTSTIEDVTFSNNTVRNTSAGINMTGRDERGGVQGKRITIKNNLFYNLGSARWGGADGFLQLSDMGPVTVDHNTFMGGPAVSTYGRPSAGLTFTNNLVGMGVFGCGAPGNQTIQNCLPDATFAGNVFFDDAAHEPEYGNYPAKNFYPDELPEVGMVDPAGGNYRLAATSRYRGRGTDGKDVGCDVEELKRAVAGVTRTPSDLK